MREVTVTKDVAADAERVWTVLTDLERSPEVISGIDRIERLDDGDGFGVGTRWRETRTIVGKQATEEMEVTAVEPGRAYTVEADSRTARYRSVLRVDPVGEHASRLSMSFGGQPKGLAGKLAADTIGRLFAGSVRKGLQRDLDDIAAAAERG